MENGDSSGLSDVPSTKNVHMPFTDHMLPISTCALTPHSESIHNFSREVLQNYSAKGVVKIIENLSHQICKYHALARSLGTSLDGEALRKELAVIQRRACDSVTLSRKQLSDAFRRAESIPKKDIAHLERSCRVLVACIHMLDRELRRTLHLYRLFPLIPDSDGIKECLFVNTGLLEKNNCKSNNSSLKLNYGLAEKYVRERDSWQELEDEILEVHNLDVALHRDEVLGPVMDYLTLCPMGLDYMSCSTASVDDVHISSNACGEENGGSRKRSNILCYFFAIMTVVCVGGGVLMGVIFMIVY